MNPVDVVVAYHQRTKHGYQRYALSAGYMDWATQPDPFRVFDGAAETALPRDVGGTTATLDGLFRNRSIAPSSPDLEGVSDLLFHSLAVSAWKQAGGARWALRVNPSSGNLHPIEGYLVLPPLAGGPATVRHYRPEDHVLETRAVLSSEAWEALSAGWPEGAFLLGLSTIHWREAWKYGERAFRYGMLDTGHALAAASLGAALRGWRLRALDTWPTDAIEAVLGLDRHGDFPIVEEREHGELIAPVSPEPGVAPAAPSAEALRLVRASGWTGRAGRLSTGHDDWPVIDEVAAASRHAGGGETADPARPRWPDLAAGNDVDARQTMRGRRSAVDFDPRGSLSRDGFLRVLDRTLPRDAPPFDAWPGEPRVHLALFVHGVDDLAPGLYVLVRDPAARDRLRGACRDGFDWVRPDGVPEGFPLERLAEGDLRGLAAQVSCTQSIAGNSVASLGMISDFERSLAEDGPVAYRRLFREAGAVGQALYLGAEAEGIRGTGIGCFFDDPVHEILGLTGIAWQSLYHFTFGHPISVARY